MEKEDTSEQIEIKSIEQGFHVVSANAGTGKTDTVASLVCIIYLREERSRFPELGPNEHVTGVKQVAILKQIMAIAFTRDSAHELDERIHGYLRAARVPPALDLYGGHYRICRTIDAYVQSWVRRRVVLTKLLQVDRDLAGSLREKCALLSPESCEEIRSRGSGDIRAGFFRTWSWLVGDTVSAVLFDALHRNDEESIAGLDAQNWPAAFQVFLGELPPPPRGSAADSKWGSAFWSDKVTAWKTYQSVMRNINDEFQRGELAQGGPGGMAQPGAQSDDSLGNEEKLAQLKIWERHQAARKEFFAVLEIARSRGYHPVRSPERLADLAVLQELAACHHWEDFTHFHRFSLQFYTAKLRYGVMDHADFLIACVDTFESYPELVERDREYPAMFELFPNPSSRAHEPGNHRFGIRAKHVVYDEKQDSSLANSRLFKLLCGRRNVAYLAVAVGDPKQAIYAFRGASSHGFAAMLDSVRQRTPGNIHHLTCSFRSLASIVALGNECVATLPDYKHTVHPSHTVYKEPGTIVLAPPITDEAEEAEWVLHRVRDILESSQETIMVLHRNNLYDHPLVARVNELSQSQPGRIQVLTIHRAKGLQAHHAFLLGMTATLMPDVRTSYTQSVNLLYVALTRPRKALYITAPFTLMRPNKDGLLERKEVGPSPFLLRLPTLCDLAQRSGWPLSLLEKGESTTRQAAGLMASRTAGKEAMLARQWKSLWPDVQIGAGPGEEYSDESGSAAVPENIRKMSRRSLYEDGKLSIESVPRLDEGMRRRVREKLRRAFMKNGAVPGLSRDEYILAMKENWILKPAQGGPLSIGPTIAELAYAQA